MNSEFLRYLKTDDVLFQSQSRIVLVLEQIVSSTDNPKKHANMYIREYFLYKNTYVICLHVFGGYPHQGYLSFRPPDMRAGARARAF